jgi:hypothetical protein
MSSVHVSLDNMYVCTYLGIKGLKIGCELWDAQEVGEVESPFWFPPFVGLAYQRQGYCVYIDYRA